MCGQDWLENGNWVGAAFSGKPNYWRNGGGFFGGDDHCLAERSYSRVFVFAYKYFTTSVLNILWLLRKVFRVGLSRDQASVDVDGRNALDKRGENGGNCHESRGEKARRKAEEKRQARLEKELLEEEERKQREEVARLVEEQRRLRDEKIETEKEQGKRSPTLKVRESRKEAEKRRHERKKEKDRGSSKSNSDVEELEKRASKESEPHKKCDGDRRENPRTGSESVKAHGAEVGHAFKGTPANSHGRGVAGTRYLDHVRGTFLSSSRAFTGGGFFGKNSTYTSREPRSNAFLDHSQTYTNRREVSQPDRVSSKSSGNGDEKNITRPVLIEAQQGPVPKKSWQQLFTRSSSASASPPSSSNVISRPTGNFKPEARSSSFTCSPPTTQAFDNPINFGLPSPFTLSSFPFVSRNSGTGFQLSSEPMFPQTGEAPHQFLPEESEIFEDPCYVPDPVSLLGPVSESLDNFQLDHGFVSHTGLETPSIVNSIPLSAEINRPSPIESPMSRLRVSEERHVSPFSYSSTSKSQDLCHLPVDGSTNVNDTGTWQMWNSSPLGQDGLGLVGGSANWLLPSEVNRPKNEDILHSAPQKTMASLFKKDDRVLSGSQSPQNVLFGSLQNGGMLNSSVPGAKVQSCHVESIIYNFRSKPTSAIRFFEWSENFLGLKHTVQSYSMLCHLLLTRRMFDNARWIFDKMVEKFGDFDCLAVFDEGFKCYGSNRGTVFSFLVDSYCRIGRIDRSLELFFRLCRRSVSVSDYALVKVLSSLIDLRRLDVILDVFKLIENGMRGKPDKCFDMYGFVMNGFFKNREVEIGLEFHRKMIERGFKADIVDCNRILKSICCSCTEIANQLFLLLLDVGPKPNVVTFSTLINGYCKGRKLEEAFKLYVLMIGRGIEPDLIVYSILIDGLFKAGKFEEGHQLLSTALEKGVKLDVVIFSSTIDACIRDGDVEKGILVFKAMLKEGICPSLVTYGILVDGLCQIGRLLEAFGALGRMLKDGIEPSLLIYNSLVDGLCKAGNLRSGINLYRDMLIRGLIPDVIVYGVLVNGLSKHGRMDDATRLFYQAVKTGLAPNIYLFNTLLDGWCRLKLLKNVVNLYNQMFIYGVTPDIVTHTVISKCNSQQGKVHEMLMSFFKMLKMGFYPDVVACCVLIDGLCKHNDLTAGLRIFSLMVENGVNPDIAIYNVLIHAFFNEGRLRNALELFRQVSDCGPEPDIVTYNILIYGYCSMKMLPEAIQLFEELKLRQIRFNTITLTILIDAFCKEGRMDDAMSLFSAMVETGPIPNVVTYSSLIDGHFKSFLMEDAFKLYEHMLGNNVSPNIVSYSILIDGLSKRGLVQEASKTFSYALDRGLLPDVVAYGILIRSYCKVGRLMEAISLYNRMLADGILPDRVIQMTLREYHLLNGLGKSTCTSLDEVNRNSCSIGKL